MISTAAEGRPLALLREREGRFAIWLTPAIWVFSSTLFVLPMLVAGQEPSLYLVLSLLFIALAGTLVSLVLMIAIWRIFESARNKMLMAGGTILVAALALTALDLAAAAYLTSIQPGNQLSTSRVFRAVNNFAVFIPHFALLGSLYALMAHGRRAIQRERLLAEAESLAQQARLSALRYQLNPHFLFNTLNSISSLVMTNENGPAEEMLARLSEYLRVTLQESPDRAPTLEYELELAQAYLQIERLRFGDRMAFEVECPPALRDALVPSLLIQPLIENCVKHGVASTDRTVLIRVCARREDDDLLILVEDDGNGGGGSSGMGVGLANVRQRLSALFGPRGRLDAMRRECGFMVLVRMPLSFAGEHA